MKNFFRLAGLVVFRSRLQQALSTAAACGDHEYCRENRGRLEKLNSEIDKLVKEARELTNAPI